MEMTASGTMGRGVVSATSKSRTTEGTDGGMIIIHVQLAEDVSMEVVSEVLFGVHLLPLFLRLQARQYLGEHH